MIIINITDYPLRNNKRKFFYYSFVLVRSLISTCIFFILLGCGADKKSESEYPIIDVVCSVEKYQLVYCSDYFSSIELIPLETREGCLLSEHSNPPIILKDSFIFIGRDDALFAFSTSGKFLHQIGRKGQGPGEYMWASRFFLNTDKSVIYIEDQKILEYDYNGNHINSIQKPSVGNQRSYGFSYVGDGVFVSNIFNDGKNKYKYYLVNQDGELVDSLPNQVFFNRIGTRGGTYDQALPPIRVDNRLYLKDYINDTIYIVKDLKLQPAYVFGFGKYTFPLEYLEISDMKINPIPLNSFTFSYGLSIVGMREYFFYRVRVPDLFSKPKAKPIYNSITGGYLQNESHVYGIYNTVENTNVLLDTDEFFQKGIMNDINGGLPIVPKHYAGDGVVVDVWYAENMKEILTDEYFEKQQIKDPQAHQKLKEILKNMDVYDNPVVVVARLK